MHWSWLLFSFFWEGNIFWEIGNSHFLTEKGVKQGIKNLYIYHLSCCPENRQQLPKMNLRHFSVRLTLIPQSPNTLNHFANFRTSENTTLHLSSCVLWKYFSQQTEIGSSAFGDFTNYFAIPNLICNGGIKTLFSVNKWFI